MPDRLSDETREVLAQAEEQARLLNHPAIGTEHLLLGVLALEDCAAARLLRTAGVELEEVRERAAGALEERDIPKDTELSLTPRAVRVLELADREATTLGQEEVTPELLLIGMIREGGGVACQILVAMGADTSGLREQLLAPPSASRRPGGRRPAPRRPGPEKNLPLMPRFVSASTTGYPVGAEWTAASVRPGRGPTDFADAFEALQRFAARLGVDVDDTRVAVESVETARGPGLRLVLRHRISGPGGQRS